MNKYLKFTILAIGVAGLSYGSFRFVEGLMGIIRLKYAKVRLMSYDSPPNKTPIEDYESE